MKDAPNQWRVDQRVVSIVPPPHPPNGTRQTRQTDSRPNGRWTESRTAAVEEAEKINAKPLANTKFRIIPPVRSLHFHLKEIQMNLAKV